MPDTAFLVLIGCALVLGVVLGRLASAAGKALQGRHAGDVNHRIRALEASLRVAQKTADEASASAARQSAECTDSTLERDRLRERVDKLAAENQDLKTRLRHECGKTAMLRQELSDRAEEVARTHVELRDVRNELDVYNFGSDVVHAEVTRLKSERDELAAELTALRLRLEEAGDEADLPVPGRSR